LFDPEMRTGRFFKKILAKTNKPTQNIAQLLLMLDVV